jgi:hypothetical protein
MAINLAINVGLLRPISADPADTIGVKVLVEPTQAEEDDISRRA